MKQSSRRERRSPSQAVAEVVEEFSGKVQTAYGGAGLLRRFLRKLSVPSRLAGLEVGWAGRKFIGGEYLLCLLGALLLGLQRQCQVAALQEDPGALMALGLREVPSQSSLSRFLSSCSRRLSGQLLGMNRELVRKLRQGRVGATLDLDGQVVVARGNPGGATYGYNPKRRGSKSYFVLMGFWGEVRDILAAELYGGHRATVSAEMSQQMYRQARRALPESMRRVRLRADSAFYSHQFLSRLERDQVTYAVAVRLNEALKPRLPGLAYRKLEGTKKWALAEFEYRAAKWRQPRRLVVVRERLDPENPRRHQLTLFECDGYAYQVIATNAPWSAVAVWHFYNDRSRLENIIKESQYDFGSNHILSRRVGGNATWLALSVLAYNVTNWFREKVLEQRGHRHTAHWLRQHLILIPATLVHRSRRCYLKLWRDHPSRGLFEQAQQTLAVLQL